MAFVVTDGIHQLHITIRLRINRFPQNGITTFIMSLNRYFILIIRCFKQQTDVVIIRLGNNLNAIRHHPSDILQAGQRIQGIGKHLTHTRIGFTNDFRDILHIGGDQQMQDYHAVASRRGLSQTHGICQQTYRGSLYIETMIDVGILLANCIFNTKHIIQHFQFQNIGTVTIQARNLHSTGMHKMAGLIHLHIKTMRQVAFSRTNSVIIDCTVSFNNPNSHIHAGAEYCLTAGQEERCRHGIVSSFRKGMSSGHRIDDIGGVAEIPQHAVAGIVHFHPEINRFVGTELLISRQVSAQNVIHKQLFFQRFRLGSGSIAIRLMVAQAIDMGNKALFALQGMGSRLDMFFDESELRIGRHQ